MSVKSSTELMLYVVLTMPTLNKAYLLLFIICRVTERNSSSISVDITDDWYLIHVVTERNNNSRSVDITDDWYLIHVE
jgi:hypothetical protein